MIASGGTYTTHFCKCLLGGCKALESALRVFSLRVDNVETCQWSFFRLGFGSFLFSIINGRSFTTYIFISPPTVQSYATTRNSTNIQKYSITHTHSIYASFSFFAYSIFIIIFTGVSTFTLQGVEYFFHTVCFLCCV